MLLPVVAVIFVVVVTDFDLSKARINAAIVAARRKATSIDKNVESGEQGQQ